MERNIRRSTVVACVAITMALLLGWAATVPASDGQAVVQYVMGEVEVGVGEPPRWQAAERGTELGAGDLIRTGREGRAELLFGGATVRLYGDSMLRLPAHQSGEDARVELEHGGGLFDVEKRKDDRFEVQTPDVVVSVKGTRFGVTQGQGEPMVDVYEGTVGVRGLALERAREVLVREGFRSVGGGDAPAEIFLLDHVDPWDDWHDMSMPQTAFVAPPARQADASADRMARSSVRDQALSLAVANNPALAKRLALVRAELLGALAMRSDATLAEVTERTKESLDPLLDSGSGSVELALRSTYIQRVLSVPGDTLAVTLSGDGVLRLADSTMGQSWQLDEASLVSILQGSTGLPTGLDTVLNVTSATQEEEVATLLLGLLGK